MQVEHQMTAHRFVISMAEGQARLEYSLRDHWVNVFHTWVPDSLRGQGVADALMKACLHWCQQQHYELVATCGYAVRWLERKQRD